MDLTKIIERESKNVHYIYLYADFENDWFIAYEFSAYVLTHLFDTLKLEKKIDPDTGMYVYFTRLSDQFVVENSYNRNAAIGEEYIIVKLTDISTYLKWRVEYDKQKRDQLREEIC